MLLYSHNNVLLWPNRSIIIFFMNIPQRHTQFLSSAVFVVFYSDCWTLLCYSGFLWHLFSVRKLRLNLISKQSLCIVALPSKLLCAAQGVVLKLCPIFGNGHYECWDSFTIFKGQILCLRGYVAGLKIKISIDVIYK